MNLIPCEASGMLRINRRQNIRKGAKGILIWREGTYNPCYSVRISRNFRGTLTQVWKGKELDRQTESTCNTFVPQML